MKTKNKKTYKNKKQDIKADKQSAGISNAVLDHIRQMADTLCDAENMELVFVEYQRESSRRILRVYIDKPGGVGIDDCTYISRQLGDLLDVYLEDDVAYSLEVSSPGPERPLGKESDFHRFSGHTVKIKTHKPIAGKKKFLGKLIDITAGRIQLQLNNEIVEIPHEDISQARLVNNDGENKCL